MPTSPSDIDRDRVHLMEGARVLPHLDRKPKLGHGVFLASGAHVIGDLEIGAEASIWFNTVIRADVHHVRVGQRTNIQDNSTVHVTSGVAPCIIGDDVTIGHNAIVHACTLEDLCLIGMGATILDRARIRSGSIVGANACVTMGKEFPPNSMILGAPARVVRETTAEERELIRQSAGHYVETARSYQTAGANIYQPQGSSESHH